MVSAFSAAFYEIFDQLRVLQEEALRAVPASVRLGIDVEERVVGVGEHEDPSLVEVELHAVGEDGVLIAAKLLGEAAHHASLGAPRALQAPALDLREGLPEACPNLRERLFPEELQSPG